jgi:hypothetical protein
MPSAFRRRTSSHAHEGGVFGGYAASKDNGAGGKLFLQYPSLIQLQSTQIAEHHTTGRNSSYSDSATKRGFTMLLENAVPTMWCSCMGLTIPLEEEEKK